MELTSFLMGFAFGVLFPLLIFVALAVRKMRENREIEEWQENNFAQPTPQPRAVTTVLVNKREVKI